MGPNDRPMSLKRLGATQAVAISLRAMCGHFGQLVVVFALLHFTARIFAQPTADTFPSDPLPPQKTSDAVSFPFGEVFTLRIPSAIGEPQEVVLSRDGVMSVLNAPDGLLRPGTNFLKLNGLKAGTTELTIIGAQGEATFRVDVLLSVEQLEATIVKHFPEAHINLTSGGDKLLIVEGEVSSPAEIDPILSLLHRLVGPENVINALRVHGIMQVQLEVVFARVDRTQLRALGFNFMKSETPWYVGSQIGQLVNTPPVTIRGGELPTTGGSRVFNNVGGAATAALRPESSIFFGITDQAKAFFGYLEALQEKGVVKVLATPTLVTLSGRPAEFLTGGEQPFPTAQGAVQTPSVQFKKFGTRLNFLPVVLGGGKIRLELVPEVSTVNFNAAVNVGGIDVPQFVTQQLHATVEMMDGETLILGGIIQTEKDSRVVSVPVVGDLPVVGPLFRRVSDVHRELELLVLVTPRLVMPMNGKPCTYPGAETRNPTDHELYFGGQVEVPLDHGETRPELLSPGIDPPREPFFAPGIEPLLMPEQNLNPGPQLAPPAEVETGSMGLFRSRLFPEREGDPTIALQPERSIPDWNPASARHDSSEHSSRLWSTRRPEASKPNGVGVVRTRGR